MTDDFPDVMDRGYQSAGHSSSSQPKSAIDLRNILALNIRHFLNNRIPIYFQHKNGLHKNLFHNISAFPDDIFGKYGISVPDGMYLVGNKREQNQGYKLRIKTKGVGDIEFQSLSLIMPTDDIVSLEYFNQKGEGELTHNWAPVEVLKGRDLDDLVYKMLMEACGNPMLTISLGYQLPRSRQTR